MSGAIKAIGSSASADADGSSAVMRLRAKGSITPVSVQEDMYRLPYHWFPEERLKRFERQEKQRIVSKLIEKHEGQSIHDYLDVGCGDGRWTSDIFESLGKNLRCTGIDFSERAIGFARLISPKIDFRIQAGEALNFDPESFDLVTAIEVLEHVPDEHELGFLKELRKVLRSGGLLILTTPSTNLRLAAHHYRHYTISRLTGLLTRAGFSVMDVRGQSTKCSGARRWLRKRTNLFPIFWKLWRFTYKEAAPEKSLNLLVAARPVVG
jgi:ubiquinone/menaquinone biosynthesis C-methylase UbiE